MTKRTSNRVWVNALTTATAVQIYKVYSLAQTRYKTEFVKHKGQETLQPVDELELRTMVRKFCRRNCIYKRQFNAAQGALAAGMGNMSRALNFNIK